MVTTPMWSPAAAITTSCLWESQPVEGVHLAASSHRVGCGFLRLSTIVAFHLPSTPGDCYAIVCLSDYLPAVTWRTKTPHVLGVSYLLCWPPLCRMVGQGGLYVWAVPSLWGPLAGDKPGGWRAPGTPCGHYGDVSPGSGPLTRSIS